MMCVEPTRCGLNLTLVPYCVHDKFNKTGRQYQTRLLTQTRAYLNEATMLL